ncbi:hypothetical protein GGU11DRAFT_763522 [Lentinula aff. detonsa]|nr:hypothetical protein GGU11DRAFT_763522 [Lentinula aff. detonsa]
MCCYASVILWILLLSLKPRALCCSGTVHRLSFVAIVVLSKQSVLVGDCYISRTQREIASVCCSRFLFWGRLPHALLTQGNFGRFVFPPHLIP